MEFLKLILHSMAWDELEEAVRHFKKLVRAAEEASARHHAHGQLDSAWVPQRDGLQDCETWMTVSYHQSVAEMIDRGVGK